jgi:hypothetical protein
MFGAEAVMPTIHSQGFAGYYYQRRLLGGLWMSICGHNSGTYTHDRIKDILIQLLHPHDARASNLFGAYFQEEHGCQIIVAHRACGRESHFSRLGG